MTSIFICTDARIVEFINDLRDKCHLQINWNLRGLYMYMSHFIHYFRSFLNRNSIWQELSMLKFEIYSHLSFLFISLICYSVPNKKKKLFAFFLLCDIINVFIKISFNTRFWFAKTLRLMFQDYGTSIITDFGAVGSTFSRIKWMISYVETFGMKK